jgi:short-subunit dehydrogenase
MSRMPAAPNFFRDKSVLITGASSGIGEELAWQLAQASAKLTLCARRRERLESLAERIAALGGSTPNPVICECDVTRDGELERAVAQAVASWGSLDVAIANAGFGVAAPLQKLRLEDYRRQFETNVFGVLRTVYAALPELEKSRGNLAIIGSVAGWVSTPGASPYSMSKFALRALADAITPELRASGITVTLLSPGFVASEIRHIDNRGIHHPQSKDPVPPWLVVSAENAAREILSAIAKGKRERIVTGHGKLIVALQRFAPWLLRMGSSRGAGIRAKDETRKWD